MYKTEYRLSVVLSYDLAIRAFEDSQEHPGAATVALAQIKSCRDVDSVGAEANNIIPYHAIDYAVVEANRSEESDPVDNNCIVDGGDDVDSGTVIIKNSKGVPTGEFDVYISEPLDGTYGDLTFTPFTPEPGDPEPEWALAYAAVDSLAADASIVITGLPNGANVAIDEPGVSPITVPGIIEITGGGPK